MNTVYIFFSYLLDNFCCNLNTSISSTLYIEIPVNNIVFFLVEQFNIKEKEKEIFDKDKQIDNNKSDIQSEILVNGIKVIKNYIRQKESDINNNQEEIKYPLCQIIFIQINLRNIY